WSGLSPGVDPVIRVICKGGQAEAVEEFSNTFRLLAVQVRGTVVRQASLSNFKSAVGQLASRNWNDDPSDLCFDYSSAQRGSVHRADYQIRAVTNRTTFEMDHR